MLNNSGAVLEKAVINVARCLNEASNKSWEKISEVDLWKEIVFCILGSRTVYEQAKAFHQLLLDKGLLEIRDEYVDNPQLFEQMIEECLATPLRYVVNNKYVKSKYIYPKAKAQLIRRSLEKIYMNGSSLKEIIGRTSNSSDARQGVIENVYGVGPKQGSMFLRNIGYDTELAVLDMHVLNYMYCTGLIEKKESSISSINKYEKYECLLQEYAKTLDISMYAFDLSVWVVMRTATREMAL